MRLIWPRIIAVVFGSALVFAVAGCNGEDAAPQADGAPVQPAAASAAEPVNKLCAVEQEHEADPKVTYLHEGKLFAFCCDDCIDTFKEDPAKYADAK